MRRLVFIEQFYFPEGWGGAQLPRDVTTHLARNGFDVEVICGSDQYVPQEDDAVVDPRDAGVSIARIPRILSGDIQRLKLLRQLWFYLAAIPLLLVRRSPALFISQTNPPLVVPIVALAALLHRRPYAIVAQDIYPEIVFAHGMIQPGSLTGRILKRLFRWAYSRAALVISLGPTMSRRLVEKGVASERVQIVSNWATGAPDVVRGPENQLREAWGLEEKFVLLYSGNLGISHDIETPIRAVGELLNDIPQIRLVFIGKGSRLAEAEQLVQSLGLDSAVQFRPFVRESQIPHSLGLADLALVTLRDGFEGLVVPSKSLGYLARAIPILYIGPSSDIAELVRDAGAGICVANGDVEAVVASVRDAVDEAASLQAMGLSGARLYDKELNQLAGLGRYQQLIAEIAESSEGDR
ncbi:MAG: glycosyltransferase family 4 protein [Gammaproteobacteria bacterium]